MAIFAADILCCTMVSGQSLAIMLGGTLESSPKGPR